MQNQIVVQSDLDNEGFGQIESEDVLAPGCYWRLKSDLKLPSERSNGPSYLLHKGDVHLLIDIFEHDGAPHTVIILCHPRDGSNQEYRVLISDFIAYFEPEKDADAVRAKEQAQIMMDVSSMQSEMAQAQINPLALPDVRDAIDQAVEAFERSMVAEVASMEKDEVIRTADIRKLHRRAARRSSAAGNPLVVRTVAISDQVGQLISTGIDSEGLKDLTIEAKKRIAMAEATSKWLTQRASQMGELLKGLTPYYAEKGRVALARSSKAINYVKDITQGLKSLKLYTGDGVDVVAITEGVSAPAMQKLTLVQGKRYMDEELAVWADVDESFDWKSQNLFFETIKNSPSLVNQLFPTERCVVSVAVTRRTIQYDRNLPEYEKVISEIKNRYVFLLARDGENIHAIYSTEPSHECARRLFPTSQEVSNPFRGIDGSTIGLKDVSFGKSVERFNDIALHYKRFLILLCGLDHRMTLFGDFYPRDSALQFMSLEFQNTYFDFLEDDDHNRLIGSSMEDVDSWINRCNKAVRSGSRIVISSGSGLMGSSPQLKRLHNMTVKVHRLPDFLVATRTKTNHSISVPIESDYNSEKGFATAWLDGIDSDTHKNWFLCMDLVRVEQVRRYIYSRTSRAGSISWIRTLKRAESILTSEEVSQKELHAALFKAATENEILTPDEAHEAIHTALATWRAARRGESAPSVDDTKSVHELLTLMYPSDKIENATQEWLSALVAEMGATPLMLCRTGRNKLVLYVQASEEDKAPYAQGVHWSWVKRLVIDVLKSKLSVKSSSLVWMEEGKSNPAEIVVRQWSELPAFLNKCPSPCDLKWLKSAKESIAQVEVLLGEALAQGRARPSRSGIDESLFQDIIQNASRAFRSANHFHHVSVALPIGVYQADPKMPAKFLYAKSRAAKFIENYGTQAQFENYKSYVLGHKMNIEKAMMVDFKWVMIETEVPLKNIVMEHDSKWNSTEKSKIKSHESGGQSRKSRGIGFMQRGSTRAMRRAEGGSPRHESAEFMLSWNRATEALVGTAPHLKRNFYKENMSHFGLLRKYESMKVTSHLSNLIWDHGKSRSIANKFFSIKRVKK